ncbi:hypothetical protein Bpfe_018323 [Biomphalaria pfeifferi]|uniref:Uncharacterized protein n=1 Tax=Biomphalaria pfeifferi TaxID=112525 RepID=A0AAD8BCN7_BIOPF|nr:hypothetical protein Bpfe_018323 [Biomphalaria pfeifferi]
MHLLANFGSAADKGLGLFEDAVEGKTHVLMQREASGCFRLVRTAAIKHRKRINIAYHDCAAVYYHHANIEAFLAELQDKNRLLQAVYTGIKEKVFLGG